MNFGTFRTPHTGHHAASPQHHNSRRCDLDRSTAFYRDGLGLELAPQSNELIAYFPLRGLWLAVFPMELLSLDTRIPLEEFGRSRIVLAHNVAERMLVDQTLAEAVAAGGYDHQTRRRHGLGRLRRFLRRSR